MSSGRPLTFLFARGPHPFPRCELILTCPPRGHSAIQGTVTSSQDIDVEKEQMRVLKGRTSGDILVICNLSKSYTRFFKRTTAVQDISLGIRRGEVRRLLFGPYSVPNPCHSLTMGQPGLFSESLISELKAAFTFQEFLQHLGGESVPSENGADSLVGLILLCNCLNLRD